MAQLYLDSFDHYATADLLLKWTQLSGCSLVASRTGNGLRVPGSATIYRMLEANESDLYIGFAARFAILPTIEVRIFEWWDGQRFTKSVFGADIQNYITLDNAGVLRFYRLGSSALCATAPNTIRAATYQYIELHTVFATGATGSAEIIVDSISRASVATVQTANTNAFANMMQFTGIDHPAGVLMTIDDLYVCNASGDDPVAFMGDIEVGVILPDGAGRLNQWSVTGAANAYQAVDETTINTADYVSEGTVGDVVLFTLQDIPASYASISGIQVCAAVMKSDVGTRKIKLLVGDGSSESEGTEKSLWGGNYRFLLRPLGINPLTGVAWTLADINGLEAGVKLTG